ncbi:c-type cytochrome [Ramlibacter pallidus]|uniref:C-type cytochrome n=1 Tax=Ramlibacter pallidus TaxID=2780087 RepID=A0ABR9S041_9BURK|nr:c-type cytochrome [Ramlibacter pallidus]MBE7366667.1 c-type cytochrome [Ramlibacter pallidus]
MACHGPQGNSQVPTTPSLAGQPRIFLENQLVLIRDGMRVVPEMKGVLDGVKDEEIVQMAGYFSAQKAQPAEKGQARQDAFQRGQALAAKALCASCHNADYAGRQQIPRLAGQPEPFLMQSLKQFRDRPEPGRDTMMSAVLLGMKDAELADLAHFLAHFR